MKESFVKGVAEKALYGEVMNNETVGASVKKQPKIDCPNQYHSNTVLTATTKCSSSHHRSNCCGTTAGSIFDNAMSIGAGMRDMQQWRGSSKGGTRH